MFIIGKYAICMIDTINFLKLLYALIKISPVAVLIIFILFSVLLLYTLGNIVIFCIMLVLKTVALSCIHATFSNVLRLTQALILFNSRDLNIRHVHAFTHGY